MPPQKAAKIIPCHPGENRAPPKKQGLLSVPSANNSIGPNGMEQGIKGDKTNFSKARHPAAPATKAQPTKKGLLAVPEANRSIGADGKEKRMNGEGFNFNKNHSAAGQATKPQRKR